ncbi:type I polyketide synthase [Streptomyces rugosispiralis]|uniref:SDR family NAD(P)-dependent oxidoreductase n=1 Tax=Streptomyces rugosispiralis TaxID=2967341 RepID=A0ABT1VDH6_9ACTN|nr:type I polyketide synthase [Streptomyces rugosispiralis]MCQ8195467.1 SDR family NAD(P)-dependent oxidoreductase [Streptomyces rugosispiralis]
MGLREAAHPLLGAVVSVPDTGGVLLTGRLAPSAQSWLADHMLSGVALVPGTAIVELAVRAGDETGTPVLEELVLGQPMPLPEDGALQVQVLVGAAEDDERRAVRVYSRADESGPWVEHASGVLSPQVVAPVEAERQWPPAGAEPVALEGFYDRLAEAGYEYGPVFRGLTAVWTLDGDVFAEITLGEEQHELAGRFGIHPALLDAALHASNFCQGNEPGGATYLPFSWNGVQLHAGGATALRVRVTSTGPDNLSLHATDPHGVPVVTVGSLVLRETTAEQLRGASPSSGTDSQFTVEWTEHPLARHEVAWTDLDAVRDDGAWPPVVVADTRAYGADDGDGTDDGDDADGPESGGLPERARELTGRALAAIQRLISDDDLADSRLVVLTGGGMAVHDDTEVTDPAAAAVWGLVRAAQAEHPGRVCVIDTDDRSAGALPAALATDEPQLALRGGTAWVPRLVRARPGLAVPEAAAWHLDVTEYGTLENLALVPHPRAEAPLEAGQVRIAVRAAGQNFRDVLIALGMYEAEIGTEGAGVVAEVGPDVTDLAVGDRVMGMLPGSFGPLVVADRRTVVRMPRDWSFTAAAGVPVAYLTALYALRDLGHVQPGETVLVHAAAGGVGMAAVHLAHHFGATVLATAHPAKHHTLERVGVAEERRASSRDLAYARTFPSADLVLNSLTGEHIDASLGLLNPGGRFIEMGRTDIRDAAEVGAAHPDRTYRAFDLGADAGPDRIQELLVELVDLFEQGLIPPLPTRPWDITRAPDAFRWMSQGRHTGKIVLTLPHALDPEGTVLVTGGTGTLGSAIARHLITHHAVRNLVLASRQGPNAPGAADLHDELTALGARVRIAACDIADRGQLATLLADIPAAHPLTGVVHTAGALADGTITTLDPDRVDTVFRPKVDAVTHLHDLTHHHDLALFAVYSSAAGILGNAGQANYAAANTFLDAFVQQRRAAGLAGLSLAWGLWAETSDLSAALVTANRDRTKHGVVRPMSTEHALGLFDSALGLGLPLVVPAKLDTAKLDAAASRGEPAPGDVSPLLTGLVRPARRTLRSMAGATAEGGLTARLAALSEADQHRLLLDLVRDHTATVLGHTGKDAVDARRAFSEIGVDSLIAVELRNRLSGATGLRLPATVVFDYATPEAMAAHLRSVVAGDTASPSASAVVRAAAVDPADDPVAIVSMNCRLPGEVTGPEELWDLVSQGRDAIGPFPSDRGWDLETLFDLDPDAVGKSYVREGGFLSGAGDFDAEFFGISPREALAMDPQQRLLAETSWELFERAGIDPMSVRGQAVGVFAGVIDQGYIGHSEASPPELEGYLMTGSTTSVASGRVAYLLGLEGPAVTVDTACSSSLVALHLAVQALRAGECSMALAGGVTVIAKPSGFISFSRQRGLAPDGRSKSFSEGADGTTFSEGIGLVLLERLSDARRNGHEVLAVIRGTAVNQDGASNGLTAPNGPSQQRVIRQALANAGLSAADVDAVEAHGTGTALGDPIEAQAVLATYGQERAGDEPVWLGSLKSNIGHTQAAAGIAGLIKMVLAMRHGTLPRSLHADEPTSKVDWSQGAVSLLSESRAWPETGRRRRAGISSFGISGTNAHVILEQGPEADVAEAKTDEAGTPGLVATGGVVPWVLSGKTPAALRAQAERLVGRLESGSDADPVDVGWSLAVTRAAMEHRAVILATDAEGGAATARALAEGRPDPLLVTGRTGADGKTVFVFPGQGAQWVGMGAQLLGTSPVFAARLKECGDALAPYVDWSLIDVITGAPDAPSLERVDVVQPATFAVVVSLAALWQSVGIHPDAVIGHSQGEIAAACVAGHLTLPTAAKIVALRSQTIAHHLAGHGGMMSVLTSREEVEEALAPWQGRLWIAAHNSPRSTVVAGDADALHALHAHYTDQGTRARIIPVDYASHTGHVDTIEDQLRQTLADVTTETGAVPWLSTVDGEWIEPDTLDSGYWFRNLRQTVRFDNTVRALAEDGYRTFIEVSPHPVLTTAIQETLEANDIPNAIVTGTLRRDDDTPTRFLTHLAHLTTHGHTPNWAALYTTTNPHPTSLPTYPFQHQHYWLTPSEVSEAVADGVFWDAVERGDLASLADSLGVEEEALEPVLPGLTSWRRRNQDQSTVDSWSYRIAWDPVAAGEPPVLPGTWLVAVPSTQADDAVLTDVVATLAEHGADPVVVEVDTVERAELTARLRERMSDDSDDEYAGVVSLLAWDERIREPGTLSRGVAATVALMQAVEEIGLAAPLWCVTRGAVAVREPSEVTSTFQPLVWGMGVVQGLDQPSTWGGIVDLPRTPDGPALARLCAVLAGVDAEDQVAVRASGLFARRMRREPVTSAPMWQPRDTVLITGGTGGLGSYVARWAAGHGARHVVLLSRQGPQAPGAAELEDELIELGADVTIAACDVTDREQLAAVLAELPDGAPLSAVVHAAGLALPEKPLSKMTLAEFADVGRAKIAGARNLDDLLWERELDAFVLFSSGAAAWGSGGQSAYAASNAYLDGLAQRRRARGLAATSVAWGAWGGGLGTIDEMMGAQWRRTGLMTMDPRLAALAMAHTVGSGTAHGVVADIDWERFAPGYTMARFRPLLRGLPDVIDLLTEDTPEDGAGQTELVARLAGLSPEDQERLLTELVQAEAAAVLGHASADATGDRPFSEIGFDSLTAVELRNRLNAATGLRLPATMVFDHPRPSVLARRIRTELGQTDISSVDSVLAELERLEASLVALPKEKIERARITSRLQRMTTKVAEIEAVGANGTNGETVTERLDTASADDVFAFIDQEFGVD